MIHLSCKNRKIDTKIELTRSKSESNRALILQGLFPDQLTINHLSDSDDTKVLKAALEQFRDKDEINVGHAGTSFRFLTAFLAIQPLGKWELTGSERMKERPIKLLVEALNSMGAKISYIEKDDYPPLKIIGSQKLSNEVTIDAGISSQYISALMLTGSKMSGGLRIRLEGKITSLPYLMMTFSMMQELGIGISLDLENQTITIEGKEHLIKQSIVIEADWSAASYWFSVVALGEIGSCIHLSGLNKESRQGDAQIVKYYEQLGVQSEFIDGIWLVKKISEPACKKLKLNLADTPDVTQTLVCTCAGLGVGVEFSGLHTLRIKETDRLTALKVELEKFGVIVNIPNDNELIMDCDQNLKPPLGSIATYKDHRMAMAFAPLSLLVDVKIENEEVVSKSYPNFWNDLQKVVNVGS